MKFNSSFPIIISMENSTIKLYETTSTQIKRLNYQIIITIQTIK
jgi:hypothetical protein